MARLKTKDIGVIITDHNVHETLAITDRAYLLYEGSILESGTAEELASNPEVRRKYLGQSFELRKSFPSTPARLKKRTGSRFRAGQKIARTPKPAPATSADGYSEEDLQKRKVSINRKSGVLNNLSAVSLYNSDLRSLL